MKKQMLKVLSALLCVILLLSTMPFTSFAIATSGICGENVSWSFDESTGTLAIEGTGDMIDYEHLYGRYCPWYKNYGKLIKGVIIGNGVTNIGDYSFSWCEALTDVSIADSVTKIGKNAFEYCRKLQQIKLPQNVTVIGEDAFRDCTALESVKLGTNVTDIGGSAFSHCEKLTEIDIPNGVTAIESFTFSECKNLKEIVLPNSITMIDYFAFDGCESLTSIEIPESVESIGSYAFSDCTSLEKVSIGNGVTQIDNGAFYGCTNLKEFSMPANANAKSLFYSAETPAAAEIIAEDSRINIAWNDNTTTVTKLKIGANFDDTDFVEAVSGAFGFIESIELHPDNESFRLIDGVLYDSEVKTLLVYPTASDKTTYVMPDTVENDLTKAYSIYSMATLPAAKNLKEITFGENYLVAQIEEHLTDDFIAEYSAASKAEKRYLLDTEFSKVGNKFYLWFLLTDIEEVSVSPKNKYISADNGMLLLNYGEFSIILHQMQKYVDKYTLSENIIATEVYSFFLSHIGTLTVSDGYAENAYESAKHKYQNTKFTDEEIDRLAYGDIVLPLTSSLIAKEYSVSATNKYLSVEDGVIFSKDKSMLLAYPIGSDRTVYELPEIDYLNLFAFSWTGEGGIIKNNDLTIHLSKEVFEKTRTFHPGLHEMSAESGEKGTIAVILLVQCPASKICVESSDYVIVPSYGISSIDDYNELAAKTNEDASSRDEFVSNKAYEELLITMRSSFANEVAYAELCNGHEPTFVERITEFFTNIFNAITNFFSNILAWFAF